jgi:anti-anti-sigma factor
MVVVTVHGLVDAHRSGQLRYILWDLIDQQGNPHVVIDLRDMTLGEGTDLQLFMDASHHAQARGGHLTVRGPSGATTEALRRAGLSEALDIDPSGRHPPLDPPKSSPEVPPHLEESPCWG